MTDFIQTPHGSKLAYNQSFGKENNIVFLSGFGSDMQGKKALFIEKWAKENNYGFLRFDYSGHGLSSNNLNDTCFTDWYKDAEFLIKKLTTGKQVLIGSSMGGWIMLMLCKLLPQKVSAMIGLAPAPDFPQNLIWKNMNSSQRRQLILNKSINFVDQNGSNN
ncbi:alpha/beta hydrolase, partial [Alphaproteobacteria bacterium]|nr:alpha/beta hydrolase [Alphaproteobacteria bacterium]